MARSRIEVEWRHEWLFDAILSFCHISYFLSLISHIIFPSSLFPYYILSRRRILERRYPGKGHTSRHRIFFLNPHPDPDSHCLVTLSSCKAVTHLCYPMVGFLVLVQSLYELLDQFSEPMANFFLRVQRLNFQRNSSSLIHNTIVNTRGCRVWQFVFFSVMILFKMI